MTRDTDFARQLEVVSRWRVLAERRLEYLTELYSSGRWRRFHTEQAFVDNIRDAKRAVEAWRKLAPPPVERAMPDIPEGAIFTWPDDALTSGGGVSMMPLATLANGVGAEHHLGEA